MKYVFLSFSMLAYATFLGPAFLHLWLYAGSGNANFFYAITLVYSLAQVILVGDALHATLQAEWETSPEGQIPQKGERAVQI